MTWILEHMDWLILAGTWIALMATIYEQQGPFPWLTSG